MMILCNATQSIKKYLTSRAERMEEKWKENKEDREREIRLNREETKQRKREKEKEKERGEVSLRLHVWKLVTFQMEEIDP